MEYEFKIDHVGICLNSNNRGERTLADAYVNIGPIRLSIYMDVRLALLGRFVTKN
jgi:hypothetical protein